MTAATTDRERLIKIEGERDAYLKELRDIEKDLAQAETENRMLRREAKQFSAIKDQQGKGLVTHLIEIVKMLFYVIFALLGIKYGINK